MNKIQNSDSLRDQNDTKLEQLLKVGGMGMLKIWELSRPLRTLKKILFGLIVALLIFAVWEWSGEPLNSVRGFLAALGLLGLTIAIGKVGLGWVLKAFDFRKTAHQLLVGVALSVAGWFATWAHISIFDRLYLFKGKSKDKRG